MADLSVCWQQPLSVMADLSVCWQQPLSVMADFLGKECKKYNKKKQITAVS
jgi:hypothetical protein